MGSPNIESFTFKGKLQKSKFVMTFEYTGEDGVRRLGKGVFSPYGTFHGEHKYSWKMYDMDSLNDVYEGDGLASTYA